MEDTSPAKWHLAHVTWFYEVMVLKPFEKNFQYWNPQFAILFNSYYNGIGDKHPRKQRGLLTRPSLKEVLDWRANIERRVQALLKENTSSELQWLVQLGINHEQQHQELMLTDILHAFAQNPIPPAYDPEWRFPKSTRSGDEWVKLTEGIHTIGHTADTFHFDNEKPAHRALVGPVKHARNLVTNGEWLAFMKDGGYAKAELWLMDGFAAATNEEWQAPGHWRNIDGRWKIMTLRGLQDVDPSAPVSHVSYYEADAFARWSSKHLPTETEWEVAARAGHLNDAFGIVWQWTRSSYSPYPGYRAIEGALGEYNGKFMVNQLVLRGSSLATPSDHSRISYRNFFYPHHRWQFTGLRLADYSL